MASLLLFTRAGCCLCEGLEQKLLPLLAAGALECRDVDADPALQARYGLSVPVLALPCPGQDGWQELPRVPPRLEGEQLRAWLSKAGALPPPGFPA
jgi:hypothetical protein